MNETSKWLPLTDCHWSPAGVTPCPWMYVGLFMTWLCWPTMHRSNVASWSIFHSKSPLYRTYSQKCYHHWRRATLWRRLEPVYVNKWQYKEQIVRYLLRVCVNARRAGVNSSPIRHGGVNGSLGKHWLEKALSNRLDQCRTRMKSFQLWLVVPSQVLYVKTRCVSVQVQVILIIIIVHIDGKKLKRHFIATTETSGCN